MNPGNQKNWTGVFGFKLPQPVFNSGPVSRSPEEAGFIRRCIVDFTKNGPRDSYAIWLRQNGDDEKAAILEVSVHAYQDGLIEPFEALPLDTSWSRMLGLPLLRTLIQQTGGGQNYHRLKTLILPHLKPAVAFTYSPMEGVPDIGTSYLWGHPDLAPSDAWPVIADCSDSFGGLAGLPQDFPCAFIGQIGWRDLGKTICGQDLPRHGGVSVFAFTEVNELGIMETVIRPWDTDGPLARRAPPDALNNDPHGEGANGPFQPHTIQITEVLSLPDPTDGPFEEILPGFKWGNPDNDLYFALREACGDNELGVGGYLAGTSGGDPSPGIDWRRLLVTRVTPDCGVIHLGIPSSDLTMGRLDAAQYVWMDWDG